ncbi:vWA domain-containing protein [Halalkalibacillus halophilus]|uniref:vWA domain-containing protein n=1 Tax=Halalkalibacillus halophilus TaxID=392827 RepID=UPI000421414C|nr:VWA domain-containing protein [Halalkalibacillus halophilus]
MKKGTVKQILLITDGCSNQGEDPVAISSHISNKGVSVNVIGVLEDMQSEDPVGLTEVNDIAYAGGGVSRIVYAEELAETVQMVTKQAMNQTIQQFVNEELQQIFGKGSDTESLPPETRGEVNEVMEELGESCNLNVLLLVDTSASMQNKMPAVKEALEDLMLSLEARNGAFQYALYQFPAKRKVVNQLLDWTADASLIHKAFPKITAGGITPTGTALHEVSKLFHANMPVALDEGEVEDGPRPTFRSS